MAVPASFRNSLIIPRLIPKPPAEIIEVNYTNCNSDACLFGLGKQGRNVLLGNELLPSEVLYQPRVSWKASETDFYCLCMTDMDYGDREWLHWLVGNIEGNDLKSGNIIADYIGSCPPEKTGFHRYVFLVYMQKGKINFTEKPVSNESISGRDSFKIQEFVDKYNLDGPIAGNFFKSRQI